MGYKVAWIARSGESVEELIVASQRSPTGQRVKDPDEGFYLLDLAGTPWAILIAYGLEHLENLDSELARSLSKDGSETLRFWCSDTAMATQLECFINGARVWSVEYDCEDQAAPVLTGPVPPITHDLLKSLVDKQRVDPEVDFTYVLTAELGSKLIGFRHDQSPPEDRESVFQILELESISQSTNPVAANGPLDHLLRSLVLSGSVHGLPIKKSDGRLEIGTPELGFDAIEDGKGQIRLTLLKNGKKSRYKSSVERCAKRIHSLCSPGARSRPWPWWKRWF